MFRLLTTVCTIGLLFSGALIMNSTAATPPAGFHIDGRKVLDAKNSEFIMCGINHAHTWYEAELSKAIPAIAKTGANCVRVVLSNGKHAENWGKNSADDVKNVIKLCKDNKMIAILEVHDCTGYPEKQGAVKLSTAVDYWIELKNEFIGQEAFVIINIANEPFGNNVPDTTWVGEHKTAIKRLRDSGFKHLLMVDAANWGQDWENIMQKNAQKVFDADPDKNTMFSVHMYDVYKDAATVGTYLKTFVDKGLPLVVGEFAADHGSSSKDVDEASILSKTKELGLGYIGWSWKGNSSDLTSLDIANQWDGSSLSIWGERLINGANGIKATAKTASVFTSTAICLKHPVRASAPTGIKVSSIPGGWNITFSQKLHNNVQVTLADLKGAILMKKVRCAHGSVTIPTNKIPSGNYILSIRDGKNSQVLPVGLF